MSIGAAVYKDGWKLKPSDRLYPLGFTIHHSKTHYIKKVTKHRIHTNTNRFVLGRAGGSSPSAWGGDKIVVVTISPPPAGPMGGGGISGNGGTPTH